MTCAPLTYGTAQRLLVDYALSCIGLSARLPANRARFASVVVPYGPPTWAHDFCVPTPPDGANSCCEAFAVACDQACAQQAGINGLAAKFDGAVKQWAAHVAIAKKFGAYRTVAKDGPPTLGAIVHVEGGGSRHWFRVVDGEPGKGPFWSVDGGQNDGGYQAIKKCQREIRGAFEYVLVGGKMVQGRPVADWVDSPALLVALAARAGGTSPDAVAVSPAVSLFSTGNEGAPLEGVDVSDSNPLIGAEGIAGLRAAGIRFGFVRLTLGLRTPDVNAAAHIRALRAAAVDVIAGYGVPYPPRPFSGGKVDGREQALELDGLIRAHALNGRVMIDAEEVRSKNQVLKATGTQHRDTLEAFASTLIERGHRPILYTGKWWWDQFPELAASKLLTSLDAMISNYSDPLDAIPLPKGISKMKILQYAGSDPRGRVGRIAGIPTAIDRNHYTGPLDDLRA